MIILKHFQFWETMRRVWLSSEGNGGHARHAKAQGNGFMGSGMGDCIALLGY